MRRNVSSAECRLCGGSTYDLADGALGVVYDVCRRCGFTYKQPAFHPTQAKAKAIYDQHQNTLDNPGYVAMFETFLEQSVRPFNPGRAALDFGSGPGPVLYELLRREGFTADHYDPHYRGEEEPLNRRYDLITATEVFEHLVDPKRTLKLLVSLLKEGGLLAIMTSLRPTEDETFLSWWYRRDPTHLSFFTEDALDALIRGEPLRFIHSCERKQFTFRKDRRR